MMQVSPLRPLSTLGSGNVEEMVRLPYAIPLRFRMLDLPETKSRLRSPETGMSAVREARAIVFMASGRRAPPQASAEERRCYHRHPTPAFAQSSLARVRSF